MAATEGGRRRAGPRFVLLTDFRTHTHTRTHLNNGQKLKTNSPSFSFIHWALGLYWKKVFVCRRGDGRGGEGGSERRSRPPVISVGEGCSGNGKTRTLIIIIRFGGRRIAKAEIDGIIVKIDVLVFEKVS